MPITYHAVVVYINDEPHKVAGNYGYELICTKAGGWQLWWHAIGSDNKPRLLGGEYDGQAFRIEVNGIIVCDNEQEAGEPVSAPTDGWDGVVNAPPAPAAP